MPDIPPVPNIPPLSSVQDPNTRAVLQAMITGWRVRNGEVGDGDEKFLTVADLKGAANVSYGKGGELIIGGANKGNPGGKSVAALINGLVADITESRLWKLLGERIQQIEWMQTPEWFQQRFGAAIKTEQLLREKQGSYLAGEIATAVARSERGLAMAKRELIAESNETFAKATAVTTLQAEFNNNKALTQQRLDSLATADGVQSNAITALQQSVGTTDAKAQQALTLATSTDGAVKGAWTVKFDINGYVTGAGLGVESKGGNPSSEFIVRADRFVIGSPVDPNAPDRADIPFIVTTVPKVIGGVTYPPGTWIKTAFIADATIDNAKIKDLAVDTLKIAGNAVTVPVGVQSASTYPGAGNYVYQRLVTATMPASDVDQTVFLFGSARVGYSSGLRSTGFLLNNVTNNLVLTDSGIITGAFNTTPALTGMDVIPGGSGGRTYSFEWFGTDATAVAVGGSLFLIGVKR